MYFILAYASWSAKNFGQVKDEYLMASRTSATGMTVRPCNSFRCRLPLSEK